MIRHLVRSNTFWLYVGMAITCMAAVLATIVPFQVQASLIVVGLGIEYLAVRPAIRRFTKETRER